MSFAKSLGFTQHFHWIPRMDLRKLKSPEYDPFAEPETLGFVIPLEGFSFESTLVRGHFESGRIEDVC